MATVSLRNVVKKFGTLPVIHGADLDIESGEFVVFVGPSGCGKSTLLRMIAGLEEVSGGTIAIDGAVVNDVEPADRGIAMVFQSYALYPHMTVRENLSFGLRMNGNDKADTARRVARAMDILQIGPLSDRRPKALSGGQRQRVAIGRAIVREPKVFLFDEPLSNLDAELRVQMRVEIARLHGTLDATMIYVTHDQTEAMTLADKIVVLRDGRIEQVGRPLTLYEDPANMFVAGFVGSPRMNFLRARIVGRDAGRAIMSLTDLGDVRLALPLSEEVPQGQEVVVGVRPEHFTAPGAGACDITLAVDVAEHLGATSYIYAMAGTPGQIILQRDGMRSTEHHGKTVTAGIPADRALVFATDGRRIR
jgi:lactose/L-arabinose transport system ATP-binding protein